MLMSASCQLLPEAPNQQEIKLSKVNKHPNIVIIFADDLGYGDIQSFGAEGIRTPNIDSIGKQGFTSRDFFIPANVCSPSRAALLTGRYPMRNGIPVAVHSNEKHRKSNFGLPSDEVTIPELLKPTGYRSLMVGKWHLGFKAKGSHPLDAGFDEHFGLRSNYYNPHKSNLRYESLKDLNTLYRGHDAEQQNTDLVEVTKQYTDEVIKFIEREKDGPFFVYFAHNIVHAPHKPRQEFVGTSDKGKYGDFIHEMDHSTGRVLNTLKRLGIEDNTLVIFTSDNGANYSGSNGKLAGVKYTTMEGGHIVPAMFKWPGVIPEGQDSSTTLTSMDIFPLVADIAGVELPKDRTIDGKNPLIILQGKMSDSPHKVLYYYNGTNLQAVRKGRWKLHLPRTIADQPFWHENSAGGRVLTELDKPLLFDLENDKGETSDVSTEYPDIVASFDTDILHARTVLGDVHMIGTDQRVPPMENPQKVDRWWVKNKQENKK
jgi:arylsulfatase A-like enzyme